jgi:hypothetical protein
MCPERVSPLPGAGGDGIPALGPPHCPDASELRVFNKLVGRYPDGGPDGGLLLSLGCPRCKRLLLTGAAETDTLPIKLM